MEGLFLWFSIIKILIGYEDKCNTICTDNSITVHELIQNACKKYDADTHNKGIDSRTHIVIVLFFPFSKLDLLRDVPKGLCSGIWFSVWFYNSKSDLTDGDEPVSLRILQPSDQSMCMCLRYSEEIPEPHFGTVAGTDRHSHGDSAGAVP